MVSMASTTTRSSTMSDILIYLTVCGKGWLVIYLSWLLITSILTSLTLHLMAVGLSICVVAALKLPAPDPDTVKMVVGEEPDRADTDTAGKDWSVLQSPCSCNIHIQPGLWPTVLPVWTLQRTVWRQSGWLLRMEPSGWSLMSVLVLT